MSTTNTPLRYPGGKSSILSMIAPIINANGLSRGHYAEPYAGGCGLALSLMFKGFVHEIHLNDLDRSIWSFWYSILNDTDDFIEKIESIPVTVEEWHNQRMVIGDGRSSRFNRGFAAFFLNRTSRSGIIAKSGVIGGFSQTGEYKIDCRFNKKGLIDKIKRIAKYRHRIHVYNQDAIDFIKSADKFLPVNSFFCVDPPYYMKGAELYKNFYEPEDHKSVANVLLALERPWVLTYDNTPEIQKLYRRRRQFNFHLNYAAAEKRVGTELLIVGKGVKVPKELELATAA